MFSLTAVTKAFDHGFTLKLAKLSTCERKTTVLIGPSGSGKSTLLRLMLGLATPDSGSVRFDEQPITPENVKSLRRKMGFVAQHGGLFPHLTAEKNIVLMANQTGWSTRRIADRVEELAELAHFPRDGLQRYPAQLSGGQRQRVSLMRGLMLDPDVLLLDEPLGALDPLIRFDLQNDLKEIFRTLNKTVVLVTHDLAEAAFFGDWIVLLRDGQIIQQGTMDELVNHPSDPFVSRFVKAQRTPVFAFGAGERDR